MVIGIFVVSSNTICESTTHAYRSTQLLYSIRKFILLPGTQPGTNTPKHWVQFYFQIFFFCLRAKKIHLNIHPLSKEGNAILLYGHTEFQVQCVIIIICGALFNLRTDVEMIGNPIAIS